MIHYLKCQPISCLLIVLIWILCLVPVPETPLDDVRFIDKWVHLAMYGLLVFVIVLEYAYRHSALSFCRLIVGALLLPVVMGGLVELAQAYLTMGIRSGDWIDFAANSCGALLGFLVALPVVRVVFRR